MNQEEIQIEELAATQANSGLALEVSKILLSNNLEFIRGTMQTLQGLTGILLTSYIALLIGFRRDVGLQNKRTLLVSFLPIILWGGSLALAFITTARYLREGSAFLPGDLVTTIAAYEEVASKRSKQIFWPAILSLLGLIGFVVSFLVVFLPTPSQLTR